MAIVRSGRLCSEALTELQLYSKVLGSRVALTTATVVADILSFQYSFYLILFKVFLRTTSSRQLRVPYTK